MFGRTALHGPFVLECFTPKRVFDQRLGRKQQVLVGCHCTGKQAPQERSTFALAAGDRVDRRPYGTPGSGAEHRHHRRGQAAVTVATRPANLL